MSLLRCIHISLAALVLLVVPAVMTGCGASSVSARTQSIRIPIYGSSGHLDSGSLDPARATESTPLYVESLLYSGLMKFGPDLHVVPELAVSIPTISASGRTYTFTVRHDARFADGRQCTAADVAYSLARALRPGVGSFMARRYLGGIQGAGAVIRGMAGSLSGVRILHRYTLQIRLTSPDASFVEKLAFPVAAVVERASTRPLLAGLGPWMLAGRDRDGSMLLVRRPHYYGGQLSLNSIHLVGVRDARAAVALYLKGLLDVAAVPTEQFRALSYRTDFKQSDSLDALYAIPARNGRELAATLDRGKLLDELHAWTPALSELSSIVPPAVPDYQASPPSVDGSSLSTGSSPAIRIRTSTAPAGDPLADMMAAALSRQWPEGRDGTPVQILHMSYILPDPGRWLHIVLNTTSSSWFRDTLVHAQQLTNDPVTRMNLYGDGENWAISKGLVIPLASGTTAFLIRPAVESLQVTPLGIMPENNNWSLVSVT